MMDLSRAASQKSRFVVVVLLATLSGLASFIPSASCATVKVDYGHWLQPLVSRTDNLTILNNTDIVLQVTCAAKFPTEWVANFDYQNDANAKGHFRMEWTDRKFDTSIDEPSYNYIAWIQVQYSELREAQTLVCRSVANPADNVLVKFSPVNDQFHITKHPDQPVERPEAKGTGTPSCGSDIKFEVAELANGYYWRCNGESSKGSIKFHDCGTAALCANTLRAVKSLPKCFTTTKDLSPKDVISDSTWVQLVHRNKNAHAGIVECILPDGGDGKQTRAAVEYFLEGIKSESGTNPRKMHFSQPDFQMRDMMWMDPSLTKDTYFTRDILETQCIIPKYGFSFDPVLIVTLNGSRLLFDKDYTEVEEGGERLLWSKEVTVNLPHFGAGTYEIQCIAPVWNTTEWANHTKTITVKDVVPPRLESGDKSVNVTYKDGDTNMRLVCDAVGVPPPAVKWNYSPAPGIREDGNVLIFARISAVFLDGARITCTAENEFGQKVTKAFNIHVEEGDADSDSGISGTTIAIIIVGLLIGALLVAGLFFLYCKFLKLGSAIATYLTYEEVKEFREGRKTANAKSNTKSNHGYENTEGALKKEDDEQPFAIESLPYNSEFEVAKENFFVDMNAELGSGEYGIVFKGHIKLNPRDKNPIQVAVKTVRTNVHINYFKALMSELKILAYIGHNDHIVNLIGAHSSNIKNRELYVGVELCKTSLLRFLQENRQSFKNFVEPKSGELGTETSFSDYQNQSLVNSATMSTFDLIRWSSEIASGMEFLAKKRVVHGDLATRNILISFDLHAKICDFGLARQLIDYNYIKSQQCPLPWKWMALESLSQMKFSTKSDVWAYGVTLWEIFSLGNVPYPGMAWNIDFIDQLQNGLRMSKPAYASSRIYDVMIQCWHESPKERPSFTEIKQFFQEIELK